MIESSVADSDVLKSSFIDHRHLPKLTSSGSTVAVVICRITFLAGIQKPLCWQDTRPLWSLRLKLTLALTSNDHSSFFTFDRFNIGQSKTVSTKIKICAKMIKSARALQTLRARVGGRKKKLGSVRTFPISRCPAARWATTKSSRMGRFTSESYSYCSTPHRPSLVSKLDNQSKSFTNGVFVT